MPDVGFRLPKGAGQQGSGVIQAYRYGLFAPGKSRIVIDTTGPVRVEAAAIASRPGSHGTRLNIDLTPTDRGELPGDAPAAGAAPQGDAGTRARGGRRGPRRTPSPSSSSTRGTAASTPVRPAAR